MYPSAAKRPWLTPTRAAQPGPRITMRAARAVGCWASLTGPAPRCGRPYENPMPEINGPDTGVSIGRRKISFGAPGKKRPAIFALDGPQGLRSETPPQKLARSKSKSTPKSKTLCQPVQLLTEGLSRFLRSQPRRIGLGSPRQARPRLGPDQNIMGGLRGRSKPELSTLLISGTFYFAATGRPCLRPCLRLPRR